MPSALDSIPNSSGVSSVVNHLLSFWCTVLKNARPLSGTSHAVTSLIKPQMGPSLLSRTPPLLIAVGVLAALGTVCWIATKIIFPKQPPTPQPGDLSGRATDVTPTSIPASASENGRTDAGSLTPPPPPTNTTAPVSADAQRTDAVTPAPVAADANGGAGTGSLTPPLPTTTTASVSADAQRTDAVTPAPVPVPADANDGAGKKSLPPQPTATIALSEKPDAVTPIPSLPEHPSPSSLVEATEPLSSNPNPQTSPGRKSPPGSPSSSEEGRGSSSDSEIETKKLPLTSPQPSAVLPPASPLGTLVGVVTNFVKDTRHFTKWTKYGIIRDQLEAFTQSQNAKLYTTTSNNSEKEVEIANAWNELLETILQPKNFKNADEQYRATVLCLREIRQLFSTADEAAKQKFSRELEFIRDLARVRFEVELYPYCQELLEMALNMPLPELTFDNILEQIEVRTIALKNIQPDLKMNGVAYQVARLSGAVNVKFDPLLRTIPYKDGRITANGRSVDILWHATPVTHHDPYGLLLRAAKAVIPNRVLSLFTYIPYVSNLVGTNPPTTTADYVAFIEGAEAKKENILHVILENGDEGNEKARVQARLKLGVYHKNFYPLALRLDGKFFERHDLDANSKRSETIEEPLEGLKNRFRAKLLSDLGDFEEEDMTASTLHTNQVETQLKDNGFCVPQKVRDKSNLEMHIGFLLDEVQNIYFPGVQNITTVEQHQAFLILSYVHIILFLCWNMEISILEALCKDDKDRGNVIKTILKLHFLYITGQIKHDTLAAVLTHMLARPFIVQKGPIIPSRLKLLQRTIPFMSAARKSTPVPSTKVVFGQETIHDPSYTVTKPPGQTIHPNNATSRTVEEYQAFLENHQPVLIPPHTSNLIPALGQNREGIHKAIFAFLHDRCSFSEEKALSASCSFQVLYTHLNGIFENHSLGISVRLDQKSSSAPNDGFRLTVGTDNLKLYAVFTISNGTVNYGSINASMKIKDNQPEQAQFEYSLAKV